MRKTRSATRTETPPPQVRGLLRRRDREHPRREAWTRRMASIPESKAPWLKLWVRDFVASTHAMTAAQVGAHLRMMLEAWERGSVPADPTALKRITGEIDEREMREVLDRWQREGDRLTNRRLEQERADITELHERRSEAGRRNSLRRWHPDAIGNANGMPVALPVGMLSTEEQKSRRAEGQSAEGQSAEHDQHGALAAPPARARGGVVFDYATGRLDGITDSHRERWAAAYPAVEIEQQVAAAAAWLAANPKQRKKNVERFLTNWLARQQERGGSRQHRVSSISPRTIDEVPEHLRF